MFSMTHLQLLLILSFHSFKNQGNVLKARLLWFFYGFVCVFVGWLIGWGFLFVWGVVFFVWFGHLGFILLLLIGYRVFCLFVCSFYFNRRRAYLLLSGLLEDIFGDTPNFLYIYEIKKKHFIHFVLFWLRKLKLELNFF